MRLVCGWAPVLSPQLPRPGQRWSPGGWGPRQVATCPSHLLVGASEALCPGEGPKQGRPLCPLQLAHQAQAPWGCCASFPARWQPLGSPPRLHCRLGLLGSPLGLRRGLGAGRARLGWPWVRGGACRSSASAAQRPYDIHSGNAAESLVQLFSTVSVQYVPTWSKEMVALLRKVSPSRPCLERRPGRTRGARRAPCPEGEQPGGPGPAKASGSCLVSLSGRASSLAPPPAPCPALRARPT